MGFEVVPAEVVEIQDAVMEARESLFETAARLELSISKVVKAGQMLRAKRVQTEHGAWMQWVEENITQVLDVTYHTVRNWIKLAEFSERSGVDLENAHTIRQAYVLAGLLPESESSQGGANPRASNYLVHFSRFERAIKAQFQERPIESWNPQDKQVLRQRLEPLVELYERLVSA